MAKLLLNYSVGLPPLEVGLHVTCGDVLRVDAEGGSLAIQVGETAAHPLVGAWRGAHVSATPTAEDADAQIAIEIAEAAADAAADGLAPLQPNRTLSLRGVRSGLVRLALRVEPPGDARRLDDVSSVSSVSSAVSSGSSVSIN